MKKTARERFQAKASKRVTLDFGYDGKMTASLNMLNSLSLCMREAVENLERQELYSLANSIQKKIEIIDNAIEASGLFQLLEEVEQEEQEEG